MAEDSGHAWFESELYAIGREMAYPPTPDVIGRVGVRLRQKPSRGFGMPLLRRPTPLRAALAVLAALIVLAGVALALIPSSRDALAEFFGLRNIRVIQVDGTPTPATGTPAPERQLIGAVTLDEARRMVGFPILLPTYPEGIGVPGRVYVQLLTPARSDEVQVVMEYEAMPPQMDGSSFTLYSFRTRGAFLKLTPSETQVENLAVRGSKAFWIEGGEHFMKFLDEFGREQFEHARVVTGNTLAWEQGDVTYRLETTLPLEEALKIAESLR
ncbi:MAG: DUF4367 domain-containing protein [Chloroflexi bacterium]|nr:DUF4367 domain-containing protein [Chloroflexota bacterium]